jgi:predicted DCC family thiol-disulfide oxidoreductase YuxK
MMGPTFGVFIMCNLFWVPWERLGARLASLLPHRRYAVLFDGACGICRPAVLVIQRLDLLNVIDVYDCAYDWTRVQRQFPDVDREAALQRMQVIEEDGTVTAGFDGYRTLARALPIGWLLLPVVHLPGVRTLGVRAYDWIAGRRHRNVCELALPRPSNRF